MGSILTCCKRTNYSIDQDDSSDSDTGINGLIPDDDEISNCSSQQRPSNKSIKSNSTFIIEGKIKQHVTIEDFDRINLLGIGSFGKVILVRYRETGQIFAMKILKKSLIKRRNEETHTKTERHILATFENPFIVNLFYAFHDEKYLYLVTEFMQGGELFYHLHREHFFSNERTKFYAAEMVLALDYMHKNNCMYRDLKPENVLLGQDGHIKLTDFGLSKIVLEDNNKAFTICGTPQYLAPEILDNKGYDSTVDWWSLGALIYEMLSGTPPYKYKKGQKIDISIYKKQVTLYNHFTNEAKKIIKDLLVLNPTKRLGYGKNGIEHIKKHPFFQGINWDDLYNKKIKPPFVPQINGELDLSNFDKTFTDFDIKNVDVSGDSGSSGKNSKNSGGGRGADSDDFKGFSYVKPGLNDKVNENKDEWGEGTIANCDKIKEDDGDDCNKDI